MTSRELILPVSTSLFSVEEWRQVEGLMARLNPSQRLWLGGYLSSVGDVQAGDVLEREKTQAPDRVLVAYGTETGNSKTLAYQLAEKALQADVSVEVVNLAEYRVRQLQREQVMLIICSTHGDGEPPEPISEFYSALMKENDAGLQQLKFAVLALGDSSYPLFCETGKAIEQRLLQLGAQPILPRTDCDVDFQGAADQWMQEVIAALPKTTAATKSTAAVPSPKAASTSSRANPCVAEVIDNICLTASKSARVIHHLELALPESLQLQPGDGVGVFANNSASLIKRVLQLGGLDETSDVVVSKTRMTLAEALVNHVDLVIPGKKFLTGWAEWSQQPHLLKLASAEFAEQRQFLREHQIIDIMQAYPAAPDAQAFVDALRPLQPRIYDVANYDADEDEVHILVKAYRYAFGSREELGVASSWLNGLSAGSAVRLFPHTNKKFHLPDNPDVPLILVGYETGISPYRAFMQQIKTEQRQHPCWMMLDVDAVSDEVIYQLDWLTARNSGCLLHIDPVACVGDDLTGFSGRLMEHRTRLIEWLLMGAHIYLCGDRSLLQEVIETLEQLCNTAGCHERLAKGITWEQLISQQRIHLNLY